MKVIVAIDSFKGSLTSEQAGAAVRAGVLRAVPDAEVIVKPISDGGEGMLAALLTALPGEVISVEVTGPYGEPVRADYGWLPEEKLAVIEVAAAAGITLSEQRDPKRATTFGVGEMICDAVRRGYRRFVIGLGGSATNDAGVGMLSALGFRFLDRSGKPCDVFGGELGRVEKVLFAHVLPELSACEFLVACDVGNPLCGAKGCTRTFGPQKGITADEQRAADEAMAHFADVTAAVTGKDYRDAPGAGAAGGLGFAFLSYLGGTLKPGIEWITDVIQLEQCMDGADLVVTGEGRLDEQTACGKVPAGVAACARRHNVPVVALAGAVSPGAETCHAKGIDAYFSVLPEVLTFEQAMEPETAKDNLSRTAEQIVHLIRAVGGDC